LFNFDRESIRDQPRMTAEVERPRWWLGQKLAAFDVATKIVLPASVAAPGFVAPGHRRGDAEPPKAPFARGFAPVTTGAWSQLIGLHDAGEREA
jgi:hypothetical protein